MKVAPCPNCGSKNLFKSDAVSAGVFLPQLGGTFGTEKFHVVLCGNCGLTRFFARQEALRRVADAKKWQPI